MILNEEQQAAVDTLTDFIMAGDDQFIRLIGAAGTGKTTVIQHVLKAVKTEIPVTFTAPTNKAVKVLARMAAANSLSVECVTIHRLLGLKLSTKGGLQVLEHAGKMPVRLKPEAVVVVDEMSMLDAQLLDFILEAGGRFIFMGDSYQLPPVNEVSSPVFLMDCEQCVLSKVMRQRDENPILGLCTDLRARMDDGGLINITEAKSPDGRIGVHVRSGADFVTWMPQIFNEQRFDEDTDLVRVIAWRNKTVDAYNKLIQGYRYPNLTTPFAIGEPVVFSEPLQLVSSLEEWTSKAPEGQKVDDILCSTETEGRVVAIEPLKDFMLVPTEAQVAAGFVFAPIHLPRYKVTVKTTEGVEVSCTVTSDKEGLANLLCMVSTYSQGARKRFAWWQFWLMKGHFASLRPAYAMTAHKSQGSTFTNVFVDVADIMVNQNRTEAMRCLYVAMSRASNNAVVKLY